jgi:hypothetical protein
LTRVDWTFSTSEGTLAGDILWLATIAFVFAISTGMAGRADSLGHLFIGNN